MRCVRMMFLCCVVGFGGLLGPRIAKADESFVGMWDCFAFDPVFLQADARQMPPPPSATPLNPKSAEILKAQSKKALSFDLDLTIDDIVAK